MAANANTHIDIDALCVSFELRLLTQTRRKTHKRLQSLRQLCKQTFSGFMCTEIVWAVLTTEHTKVTGRPPISVLQAAAKNNKLFILFHHKPSFRVTHTGRFTKSQIFCLTLLSRNLQVHDWCRFNHRSSLHHNHKWRDVRWCDSFVVVILVSHSNQAKSKWCGLKCSATLKGSETKYFHNHKVQTVLVVSGFLCHVCFCFWSSKSKEI